MNNTYIDLVQQTFNFPQPGLNVKDGYLEFNGLDLKAIIAKYGTPLKLTYLPKIGMQINQAKDMFAKAFKKHKYEGEYYYCYCTKSSHFSFVVEEALKHGIHLEDVVRLRPGDHQKAAREKEDHKGHFYYLQRL
jgi:arginine decarboxylase